jgi:hypothetical protein
MKTMKIAFVPVVAAVTMLGMLSCADEAGNNPAPANRTTLNLQAATNKQPISKAGRTAAVNNLVFTSGSITFREVVFDADRADTDQSISVTHEQIAVLDFATGVITPAVNIKVPAGTYNDVYLGIEIQDEGDKPGIVIEGTYTNSDNVVKPIRFEFNSGEVFEAEADSVVLNENTNVVTRITFDPQYWFATITASQLDNATMTGGRILISATSNVNIFSIVAERLDDRTEADFDTEADSD